MSLLNLTGMKPRSDVFRGARPAIVLLLWSAGCAAAQAPLSRVRPLPTTPARFGRVLSGLDGIAGPLKALYVELHRNPDLSLREARTAALLAKRIKGLGFEVTTKVGGHGIVGILRNGSGPVVMLRTDLDGLPLLEKTGLPYASRVKRTNRFGKIVPAMHGCGHDLHMTAWLGAATLLAKARDQWSGTLMLIGQPAEEIGAGAEAMLGDGLFSKILKPSAALALHMNPSLPSGTVGYTSGWALANVDSVDIVIHGKGGHGAYPHNAVDPIAIAAQTIVALQTLVSREVDPRSPAVVTVGSIHGGHKHNIIPDEVRLQLTVRSYTPGVRKQLLDGIARIAKETAAAARAPRAPEVKLTESTPSTYNHPELTKRVVSSFVRVLGKDAVRRLEPVMGGEDFGRYGRAGVPALMFWLGAVAPETIRKAKSAGRSLPSLHSPLFAPDPDRAIRTGVIALTTGALTLLGRRQPGG